VLSGEGERWRNIFTEDTIEFQENVSIAEILKNFPVGLLMNHDRSH
jgi:maltooligosyltrehalose synthase